MKLQTILLVMIIILGFSLRFIDVSNIPPGLYVDEVSIGYNAYTILTTGKDQYGVPHPLWFKSFGEYKLPVYIYSVTAAMALFGKSEFAVRLPSILSGTLTIFIFYLFLQKLLVMEKDTLLQKKLQYLPLLATFLLAISSWHIQFSRGGFEVTEGTLFYLLGCYFFLFFKQIRSVKLIILSLFFFVLSMYTYNTFRVLAPVALVFIGFNLKVYKNPKSVPYILFTAVLLLPVLLFSLSSGGTARFDEASAFSELGIKNTLHEFILYPIGYLRNYLSFYSFDFLFNYGDGFGRHQIPNFGELYRWQLPFFLGGLYVLFRQKNSLIKYATFLLFFTVPLAGALAVPSPHALRSLPLVLPCMIIIAEGILFFIQNFKQFKYTVTAVVVIFLIATYEFSLYLHFYYIHYPQVNQLDWGGGYKELILSAEKLQNNYQHIIIDKNLSAAPIYIHFYDDSLTYMYVPVTWKMPKAWKGSKVLYLRPYYGNRTGDGLVKNIYLNDPNKLIFAQLWEIK